MSMKIKKDIRSIQIQDDDERALILQKVSDLLTYLYEDRGVEDQECGVIDGAIDAYIYGYGDFEDALEARLMAIGTEHHIHFRVGTFYETESYVAKRIGYGHDNVVIFSSNSWLYND